MKPPMSSTLFNSLIHNRPNGWLAPPCPAAPQGGAHPCGFDSLRRSKGDFKVEMCRLPTLASAMVSEKSWSIDAVARLFLGVVVTLCCGMFLTGLLDSVKLGLSQDQLQFLQMIVLVVFFQGAALVWIAVFLRQSNISWRAAFGLRPPSRARAVAAGLAVGVMVLPAVWLLQWISEGVMEWLKFKPVAQGAVKELQNTDLPVPEKILFGVLIILLAAIWKEALFR